MSTTLPLDVNSFEPFKKDFLEFLVKQGAVINIPKKFEIVRFLFNDNIGSIVFNNKGKITQANKLAQDAWDAFRTKNTSWKPNKNNKELDLRKDMIYQLSIRDGWHCFYCNKLLDENTSTIEHLVSRHDGGPNHPSNLFLSCNDCNVKVGREAAHIKIKMRDYFQKKK